MKMVQPDYLATYGEVEIYFYTQSRYDVHGKEVEDGFWCIGEWKTPEGGKEGDEYLDIEAEFSDRDVDSPLYSLLNYIDNKEEH